MAAENSSPGPTRSQTLPRALIIRRRAVFDAARARGQRLNNRWFTLGFLPREDTQSATVAFLTPKRLGPATVRNRLRRRMREIYRRDLQHGHEPRYLIWIARPPALELDFAALKKAMHDLAARLPS